MQLHILATQFLAKSPHHLEFMKGVITAFPQLKIIWCHRDPKVCIPSFLSMVYHSRGMFSDKISTNQVKDHWLRKMNRMISSGIKIIPLDTEHVSYTELLESPLKVLHRVLGAPGIDTGRDKYDSSHRYSLSDLELSPESIHKEY